MVILVCIIEQVFGTPIASIIASWADLAAMVAGLF
jgi:hypothetical protein